MLGQIVPVVGQRVDSTLVAGSDLQQILFVLGVLVGQAFEHTILHLDDFVESLGLVFECDHDVSHLLGLSQPLAHSDVLHFL